MQHKAVLLWELPELRELPSMSTGASQGGDCFRLSFKDP